YAIEHSVKREKQTQLRFLEPKTALQYRHRDAEVLTHEIERGVADDRSQQDALLPVAVLPATVSASCDSIGMEAAGAKILSKRPNAGGCEIDSATMPVSI